MIRIELTDGWVLVTHPDHARLAGVFAEHWGNVDFGRPAPAGPVLEAVRAHDDAWADRDATPYLTHEGRPSAFSRELVGTYDSFEEIDLADYLAVRGQATEVVARRDPYAAILVSLHTHNLLTEQTDVAAMTPAQRALHGDFIGAQEGRRAELLEICASRPEVAAFATAENLQAGFEFLQACDSLSLLLCTDFPSPAPLRHRHRRRDGTEVTIHYEPLGEGRARVQPWPFAGHALKVEIPCRRVSGNTFANVEVFRAAYRAAPVEMRVVTLVP